MKQFAFGLLGADDYLHKHLLGWMEASGGMISCEDIQLRVAMEARKTLGACCPTGVIYPNHNLFLESREPGYFGGGYYFDLQICSPQREDVSAMLEKSVRKQSHRNADEVTAYFGKCYEMLPAVVLVDPWHGVDLPSKALGISDRINSFRASLILSHRIARWTKWNVQTGVTSQHSELLYANSIGHSTL